MMKLALLLCLSLALTAVWAEEEEKKEEKKAADGEIEEENGVLVLTEKNFDKALEDNEHILVEFYAPWCGHCKQLAPEYEKAAEKLSKSGSKIKLAKVDATIERGLGDKHGVKGFPTLKFFKNAVAKEYNGPRESEGIVSWLEKKTGPPAKEVKTVEELKAMTEEKDVVVVGFFKDQTSEAGKAFLKAAEDNDDQAFAVTGAQAVFDEWKVKKDGAVVMLTTFDDGRADYDGDATDSEALDTWVRKEALPLVSEFTPENAPKIFGAKVRAHLLLIAPKDGDDFEKQVAALKPAAKKHKGEIVFVTLDSAKADNKQILDFFGLKEDDIPEYIIYEMEASAKYLAKIDKVVGSEVSKFCSDFVEGKLTRTLKSEDLPEDWDKEPVKVLVSTNFKEVAMDKKKDVFVEFYAPWCGHCKALAPKWDDLGKHFKDSDSVVIAKMDSTGNEIEEVSVEGFPTLKLFRKDTNEIVDYNGKRETEDMIKFIENGGKVVEEEEEEEGDDDDDDSDEDEDKAKHTEL